MPNGFLINEPISKCAASSEDLEQTPRSNNLIQLQLWGCDLRRSRFKAEGRFHWCSELEGLHLIETGRKGSEFGYLLILYNDQIVILKNLDSILL